MECGLLSLQKLVWSTDHNATYMRTLEIIRSCIIPGKKREKKNLVRTPTNLLSETRAMAYNALGPIFLLKISKALNSALEDSFKKALMSFVDASERMPFFFLV